MYVCVELLNVSVSLPQAQFIMSVILYVSETKEEIRFNTRRQRVALSPLLHLLYWTRRNKTNIMIHCSIIPIPIFYYDTTKVQKKKYAVFKYCGCLI